MRGRKALRKQFTKKELAVLAREKKKLKKAEDLVKHKQKVLADREERKQQTVIKNRLKKRELKEDVEEKEIIIPKVNPLKNIPLQINPKLTVFISADQDPDLVRAKYGVKPVNNKGRGLTKPLRFVGRKVKVKKKRTDYPMPALLARMQELIILCENSTCIPKLDLAKQELRILSGLEPKPFGFKLYQRYTSYP